MKITPDILRRQWDSINYKDGGFLQIDTIHALQWHIGYQSICQKTLLLVCDTKIEAVESSQCIKVTRRRRENDNRWVLSFELLHDEQEGVFAIFCSDVIEYSKVAANESEALKLVIARCRQWNQLFESQKNGLMDERKRKGLLGELLFLRELMTQEADAMTIIQGWVGADGADQDFMYANHWYEVKTVGSSAASVTISSLEQLDCNYDGTLVVMRIDKTAPDKPDALSLNDVVMQIDDDLTDSLEALSLFRSKLNAYGYIDLQAYSEQKYCYSASQRYEIDDGFPKLIRRNVPVQIENAHYELSLSSLAAWLKG